MLKTGKYERITTQTHKQIMREIKFRAKDAKTNKWVFGDLSHDQTPNEAGTFRPVVRVGGHDIRPATIGQLTEYRDRDGNPIYEGDVVRYCRSRYDAANGSAYEIGWQDGAFALLEPDTGDFYDTLAAYTPQEDFEIVGNSTDGYDYLDADTPLNIHDFSDWLDKHLAVLEADSTPAV